MGQQNHSPSTSPEESVSRFDKAAATWEEKPLRVALAASVTAALRKHIPLKSSMQVLEYGCGTGMISRAISPQVKSVTAADTSPQMLAVLRQKAQEEHCANISTTLLDLSREAAPGECFDLIVSSMTLHHISNLEAVISRFLTILRPAGYLAVADLAPEDGNFHDDNTGVAHYGVDPSEIMKLFKKYGGVRPDSRQAHVIEKNGRPYPVVFTWCQKG